MSDSVHSSLIYCKQSYVTAASDLFQIMGTNRPTVTHIVYASIMTKHIKDGAVSAKEIET